MPNGADLRSQLRGGWGVSFVCFFLMIASFFLVVIGGSIYGLLGLTGEMLFLVIVVTLALRGLQSQIDALYSALRGIRDESDLSDEMRAGLGLKNQCR